MTEKVDFKQALEALKDGKQDVVLHHPSTTEPHRVVMLIAR